MGTRGLPDISKPVNVFCMPERPVPCCAPLLTTPLSDADAHQLAVALKALADPVRLRLVSLIAASDDGEACACDLTGPIGRSQATVSHHLSQLVKAGIIEREQRGKWAWFKLDRGRIESVCATLSSPDPNR